MNVHSLRPHVADLRHDLRTFVLEQPTVTIDLMLAETRENDPFYAQIVREFHDRAHARRRAFPLFERFAWGVALARLPATFEQYFMSVDGSARRNFKKAERLGYAFARIDPNAHRDEIQAVLRSAEVRQGPMPPSLLRRELPVCTDPPSRTNVHDYAWFGVLREGKVVAYASIFVAGELCALETIYGHAAHQEDGVVPRLILGIAEYVYAHYPRVRYFAYDAYFGASENLRRFKRKFGFLPHHVHWVLGGGHEAPAGERHALALDVPDAIDVQLVYRKQSDAPVHAERAIGATFHYLDNPAAIVLLRTAMATRLGPRAMLRAAAKLASGRRHYYCVTLDGRIVSDGWVSLGFCRHYVVEPEAAVIGPVWTDPNERGKGLASYALAAAVNALFDRGRSVTYIDTTRDNIGMQKAIARVSYGPPVAAYPRAREA